MHSLSENRSWRKEKEKISARRSNLCWELENKCITSLVWGVGGGVLYGGGEEEVGVKTCADLLPCP